MKILETLKSARVFYYFEEASNDYENVPAFILQGQPDMVGAKQPDCSIVLEKEAISLRRVDDFIYANGTTPGGDDGVAIAYALKHFRQSFPLNIQAVALTFILPLPFQR